MSNKINNESSPQVVEEFKEPNLKYNLSKFEYDLYHEEDDIVEKVIRVKRFELPNNGERWKIFEDNKILITIEGSKLTKKEKLFLRSINGINFLISLSKNGIKSFNYLKMELRKKLK